MWGFLTCFVLPDYGILKKFADTVFDHVGLLNLECSSYHLWYYKKPTQIQQLHEISMFIIESHFRVCDNPEMLPTYPDYRNPLLFNI